MSSPTQTKTITILVKTQPALSGSFKIPFIDAPSFKIGTGSFPMEESPLVTLSGDGKQTLSGDIKLAKVPDFGTVTYSGDFELLDEGGKGTVRWGDAQDEADWTSTVTSPVPTRGNQSYR